MGADPPPNVAPSSTGGRPPVAQAPGSGGGTDSPRREGRAPAGGGWLLHEFLGATAARAPNHAAFVAEGASITFGRLDRDSDVLAAALRRLGVRRGDRVAMLLDNSIGLVTALFGVLKAGGVFVVLSPGTREDKLLAVLKDCTPAALVAQPSAGPAVAAAVRRAPIAPACLWSDDPPGEGPPGPTLGSILAGPVGACEDPGLIDQDLAGIIYTSGSTGEPKGVMLAHRNLVSTTRSISQYLGNAPEDVVLCVLPLSFGYGLCQVFTGVQVGFTVVLERSFAFPAQLLARMAEHRVTGLPGVPTMFARLVAMAGFDAPHLPHLRFATNAAAALAPAHIRRIRAAFPALRFYSMYGQTECTRVCFLDPARLADRIESVGRAIPNCEAYVVDAAGRRVGPGVVGELVVRGANVMRGYWGKPEETARRLWDGDIPGEKVLHTGDLFRTDEEGLLYFVARTDDIFKCRGEKVSPREIEHALYDLAGVAEAAVVGVDDPLDGQAIKAVVVPHEGVSLSVDDVRRHCRERLELNLVPKFVELRDRLPKTESGKIRRSELAAIAPAPAGPGGSAGSAPARPGVPVSPAGEQPGGV